MGVGEIGCWEVGNDVKRQVRVKLCRKLEEQLRGYCINLGKNGQKLMEVQIKVKVMIWREVNVLRMYF